jgi:hypothetical protein
MKKLQFKCIITATTEYDTFLPSACLNMSSIPEMRSNLKVSPSFSPNFCHLRGDGGRKNAQCMG